MFFGLKIVARCRRARSVVAGITALFVLACQSGALADIRYSATAAPEGAPAIASCHHAAPDGSGPAHEARCQAKFPSYQPAEVEFQDVTALPAVALAPEPTAADAAASPIAALHPVRVEAPPLPILHCRLRN